MRKIRMAGVVLLLGFLAALPAIGFATGGTAFTVERFVVAESVHDREPVNVTEKIPASAENAFCFLEVRSIAKDTDAVFIWYKDNEVVSKVRAPLGQGQRWRTYSSKKLNGQAGEWKVEVRDNDGNVMDTVNFTVE
ncbi:MAG: DUF2914 domain-containing protein [Deltaproteobacteria bacterium]|nr:DUF2914 domain-containing protein [Deltaproteobacteria bacterium]